MSRKKVYDKIINIVLCISVILLFMHLTPAAFIHNPIPHSEQAERDANHRALYNEGMMSPDHLLGLMPKKVNECIEQYVDEELIISGQANDYGYGALLDYIKRLQHVLYQMFICLVTLICIHTTRRMLLRYIYNTDGPLRTFSLNIAF